MISNSLRAVVMRTVNRHGEPRTVVYFTKRLNYYMPRPQNDTPEGLALKNWLRENIEGKYTVHDSYVVFHDSDDALLCYLRFGG